MNQPLLNSREQRVTITSEGYVSTNDFLNEHLKQVDYSHQSFYIYKFRVKRGNQSWIVHKRVQDFMDLEKDIKHDPFLFLKHRDVEKERKIDDPEAVQKHILEYINSANQTSVEFKKFFLLTDIQYGDAQKHYECVMKKKAGGRHAESKCRRCGTFWGRFDKRYFSISSECVIYSTGPFENDARPREILLIDQNFQFEYGLNSTGERRGIKLTFTTRDLYLKAPDDWTFILFVVGLQFAKQESPYHQIQRFNSFAQPRMGRCKWYVDGENYFADLMDDLLLAQNQVCITDWWLSPDFFLKRPISTDPDDQTNRKSRFDLILKNIADRGVQVRIIIYDAPSFALNNDALHTERSLQMVSNNIKVLKHPSTLIPSKWSHHEKMVLIDNQIAYMGGLDICFGRMDNQKHLLHDYDEKEFWPGIDYSNSRIKDFVNVQKTDESLIDRNQTPRMPWHDIAIRIRGDSALDMYRHFMQYWNYVLFENKYDVRTQIGLLDPKKSEDKIQTQYKPNQVEPIQMKNQNQRLSLYIRQVEDEAKQDDGGQMDSKNLDIYQSQYKQNTKRLSVIGKNSQGINKEYIDIMKKQMEALQKQEQDQINYPKLIHQDTNDPDVMKMVIKKQEQVGSCQTQLLRSASQWSIGNSSQNTEQSILAAYLQLITEAKYYIYIENQFFISNTAGKDVINAISETIIVRIKQAVLKNEQFKVIVFVPLLPGFEGEIDGNAPVLKVQLHWEYATICRGEKSIYSQLLKYFSTVKCDKQVEDYIQFYSLRTHAKLKGKPVTEQIYIHSKLMIIDDEYVIMGSANINDRSMLGDRDSELAVFVEDENKVLSIMNGMKIQRSQFALTLRKSLYMEHFGLTDEEVQDPLDPKLLQNMVDIAEQNTYAYRYIFACYPDNNVTQINKLNDFKKSARIDLYDELSQTIKGNAVQFPLDFMKDENLQIRIMDKEIIVPIINFT